MTHRHWLILSLLLVAVVAGCGQPVPVPQTDNNPNPNVPKGNGAGNGHGKGTDQAKTDNPSVKLDDREGIISGEVRWEGSVEDATKSFPSGNVGMVNRNGSKTQAKPAPRLRVDSHKGVANAVVWLAKPPTNEPLEVPTVPAKLVQQEGEYWPHVQAVTKGTHLRLTNTDDDEANFQATLVDGPQRKRMFARTVQKGDPPEEVTLNAAGLIEVRSPDAPWALAYIWVFDHNYFATTGTGLEPSTDNGRFQLPRRVSPGNTSVVLWHENWHFADPKEFRVDPPLQREVKVDLPKGKGALIHWLLSDNMKK
jgi:hypothetical protein